MSGIVEPQAGAAEIGGLLDHRQCLGAVHVGAVAAKPDHPGLCAIIGRRSLHHGYFIGFPVPEVIEGDFGFHERAFRFGAASCWFWLTRRVWRSIDWLFTAQTLLRLVR